MGTRLYVNNYSSTLSASITAGDTSISVTSAAGLSALTGGDYYHLTIDDGTNVEIVKVTAVSGTTLTVVRGAEGSGSSAYTSGDAIEMRITRDSLQNPAFRAYRSTNQSIPASTGTTVEFDTESFDALGNYDTATYKFTPAKAGYYSVSASVLLESVASGKVISLYLQTGAGAFAQSTITSVAGYNDISLTDIVYLNGTTDYVLVALFHADTVARNAIPGAGATFFNAVKVA